MLQAIERPPEVWREVFKISPRHVREVRPRFDDGEPCPNHDAQPRLDIVAYLHDGNNIRSACTPVRFSSLRGTLRIAQRGSSESTSTEKFSGLDDLASLFPSVGQ